MCRSLEAIGLCALTWMLVLTAQALYGPSHLPARIPTHFNLAGQPNGWSSPLMLLMLPGIGVAAYLLMTLVARRPQAFNYPVRVTPVNRARLQALALGMIAWLKAELACLFAFIQSASIAAARNPQHGFSAAAMPLALVAIFATIGWHLVAMFRAAPNRLR